MPPDRLVKPPGRLAAREGKTAPFARQQQTKSGTVGVLLLLGAVAQMTAAGRMQQQSRVAVALRTVANKAEQAWIKGQHADSRSQSKQATSAWMAGLLVLLVRCVCDSACELLLQEQA